MTDSEATSRAEAWECDLAILTVQDRETAAILRLVENVRPQTARDGHRFYRFTVQTPPWHHGTRMTGVLWPSHDVGRVAGAIATNRLLAEVRPALLFLVGVAGGFVKNEVELGDIVVATKIVDYEMQRLSRHGTEFRLKAFEAASELVAAAQKAIADIGSVQGAERPTVRLGVVLSGDKVIASDDVSMSLLRAVPPAVAIEMEGAGVAAAVQDTSTQNAFIMIRGIVDLANEAKREQAAVWIDRTCDAVAAFTLATAYRATM